MNIYNKIRLKLRKFYIFPSTVTGGSYVICAKSEYLLNIGA